MDALAFVSGISVFMYLGFNSVYYETALTDNAGLQQSWDPSATGFIST